MSEYPYVNSILQAIEDKMLDKVKFQKLAKTSKNVFAKTLIELGYGNKEDSHDVEEIIAHELVSVKNLIDELTPQRKYTDLFFIASDAINIKFYYKQKFFGIKHFDVFVPTGTISQAILKQVILEDDFAKLSKQYRKLFLNINNKIKDIDNPRVFSALIDQVIFDYVFEQFNVMTSSALTTYFKTYIDLQNVLSLFRAKSMGWESTQLVEMLNSWGTIDKNYLVEAYGLENDALKNVFSPYYEGKITKSIKSYYEHLSLDGLRNSLDKILLEEMAMFKHDAFDIGPMIYYYLQKETEALNIRILYTSENPDISQIIEY